MSSSERPAHDPAPLADDGFGKKAAILAAITLVTGGALFVAFQKPYAETFTFVAIAGGAAAMLAAFVLFQAHREGELRDVFSIRGGDFSRGFMGAAVLFGGAYAASRYLMPLGSPRSGWLLGFYLHIGDPKVLRAHVALVVAAIVVVTVAEEVVWRWYVPRILEERVGSRQAWIYAAGLYALAHLPTAFALRGPDGGLNPVVVLGALGGGLVWGGMARRFGRILPSMFAHALFDWTVLVMFRLYGPSV